MRDENQNAHGHSAYDLLKDFGLPAIPAIGMLLSIDSTARFAAFAGVALLFGAVGVWPRLVRGFRRWRAHSRDERFAQQEFPRFKQFVRRFGDFVSNRTNDTLHAIVRSELSEPVRAALARQYEATPIELWNSLWEFFDQRLGRQQPVFAELAPSIQEFDNLIGNYHVYCVAPIFSRLPADVRERLSDEDRRKLNGFQQKHHSFITDYVQFVRALADSHPALEHFPRYLPTADPL